MSLLAIGIALDKRLATMSPALATANENVNYVPVVNTAYQQSNLLPATPDNPTIGGNHYLELGIYQVTLKYPKNTGRGAAIARAEAVKNHFPRGLSLTEAGVTLTITRTPAVAPAFMQDDRYCVPVSIQYHAHIN